VIPKTAHRTEREIWGEFAAQQPAILGALLDAVSAAVRKLPETRLELPRMAEFAEWVTAAEEALGWAPGSFMSAYEEGREEAMAGALESDPVAGAVLSFMEGREEWVGKSAELLEELASEVDEKVERSKSWPKTASHLSNRLKRLAPALRAEGLDYEDWREAGGPTRPYALHAASARNGSRGGMKRIRAGGTVAGRHRKTPGRRRAIPCGRSVPVTRRVGTAITGMRDSPGRPGTALRAPTLLTVPPQTTFPWTRPKSSRLRAMRDRPARRCQG
jgi:hypothetical protein